MSLKFLELFQGAIEFKGELIESSESENFKEMGKEYSISLWLLLQKPLKGRQVTVFHKGDNFSCQPTISLQEKNLLVKFDTGRGGSERLFASAEIPIKNWVHIVFTLKQSEFTEASLYINGNLDSEIAVRTEVSFNEGKAYLGKDPWNHGFIGSIAEPILFFSALSHEEVSNIFHSCMQNWTENNTFRTAEIFYHKNPNENSTANLIKDAEVPKLLNTARSSKKLEKNSNQPSRHERLESYFQANPKMYMKIAKMTPYVDWLAGIYRILRVSSPNYRDDEGNADSLEVDRIMPPLYQVNLYFTKKELVELAKAARCHSSGEKSSPHAQSEDLIHYLDLFDVLRAYTDSLELGDVFQIDPLPNSEKFSHIYALADEFMNNRSGNFEICVDFCVNCKTHQTSTRHNEREIASWYNEVYKDISEEFPACDIVGNKYGPPRIGTFAAYIEGIGSDELKDKSGRLKLYKTKHGKPVSRYVLDAIYLVSYVYGNTQELARFQAEFKKDSGDDYRHPDSITTLATIGENPSKLNKKREDTLELQSDQEMYCKHWGCQNRIYILGKNHKRACRYHPGRWEFGSIHGLWPENWTCCRAEWSTPGCVFGFHQGVSNTFVRHKCINRGENNPRTLKPDSFCGRTFPDPSTCGKKYKSDSKCVYHSGHREYNERGAYIWTCCNDEVDSIDPDAGGCVEDEHKFAEYPDEESKIYFITKSVTNPGVDQIKRKKESFSRTASTSRFFNTEIKPYINPYQKKKHQEALDNEIRYCLNSTCEKTYKESENHDLACQAHTGYWDFGHSGLLKGNSTIVLWEPHWRCCGGKWEDSGCKRIRHHGPVMSRMEERRWVWPAEGAKRYFLKKVSSLWKSKLAKENLSRKQVAKKYDKVCSENNINVLTSALLHRLCLSLHLHILCVSDDMSFMFKYQDVISRQAEKLLSDKNGFIDKETFLEWWFAPLERIRPEMAIS